MKTLLQKCLKGHVLTILVTLFANRLHARLGETGEGIAKRFGDEQQVHPSLSNATRAVYELEGAWRLHPGIEQHVVAELFKGLGTWNWGRVTFHGYKFGDFRVLVILLDNKSVFEYYSRGEALSKDDIEALLASNSGGNTWEKSDDSDYEIGSIQTWKVVDQTTKKESRFAVTNGGRNLAFSTPAIMIYCAESLKTIIDEAEKKKAKAIKGF